MRAVFIALPLTKDVAAVLLNPVCGCHEMLVEDTSSRNAMDFIQALVKEWTGGTTDTTFGVSRIATADRDRIMGQLYLQLFGDKIAGTIPCRQCSVPFDLDFSLRKLLQQYRISESSVDVNGRVQLSDQLSFRLPNGEDELMLETQPSEQATDFLFNRCVSGVLTDENAVQVQARMSDVAPLLNIDLHAVCPECAASQSLSFDMQHYLLSKLLQDRPLLIRDIHLIALHYHWSPDTILALPRSQRKQYVELIQSQFA